MSQIERKRRSAYTMEEFDPYIGKSGRDNRHILTLPNVEDVEPMLFLNMIASGGHSLVPRWGYSRPEPDSGWTNWTQFFLADGGEGYAIIYRGGGARTVQFSICKHEKVDTGTPDGHRRGWHPGYCAKCGVDMSIDSGD